MRNSPLEWLRGFAALYVFLSHYSNLGIHDLAGSWLSFLSFGTEAVIVFFLLSGAVIRLSTDRKSPSWREFLRRRGGRILPLYWFAIVFTLVSQQEISGSTDPWQTVASNLLMLQTTEDFIAQPLTLNEPLWSLSFETFFYCVFAASIGRFQGTFLRCWCAIGLIAAA